MIRLMIKGHLIIPFGRPKWDIKKIRIAGVSTEGTYFESDTPCVHIDANKDGSGPLRLRHIRDVFPEQLPVHKNTQKALAAICNHLQENCELQNEFERRFLDLYFAYCLSTLSPPPILVAHSQKTNDPLPVPYNDPNWVFHALLPLPQAHLYLTDPLKEGFSYIPDNMVKVDFAFWTGQQIVGVEITGSSHVGDPKHIRKDRMLQRAGVHVIHILNDELVKHGTKAISSLLPRPMTRFWEGAEDEYCYNPLHLPF